jgi:4-amino-4-deoxy-L-arabinose transferase-like glycosyltransferase
MAAVPPDLRLQRLAPWLIGVGGLLLFILGLDHRDFIHLEARFALFAQTMFREGTGFFPTLYGEPYPDYPATGTLLIDLVSLLTGRVTTVTAVLPTATAAALTMVFTYLIGSLHAPRWGLYAVLFELCTYQYLATARSVSLDPFVAMATTGCFYAAYSAALLDRPWRVSLIPLGWAFGFLMRGPIGLIIPAAVVAVFYLLERRWTRFISMSALALGLLALCMVGLLAAARAQGGPGFADQVLRFEALGRVAAGTLEHPPVYSYAVNALAAFALSFPVAVALVAFGFRALIRPATNEWRLLRHLGAWTLTVMAGLSIPAKQEIRYLIPVVPAVALMAAALLVVTPPHALLQQLRKVVLRLLLLMPWLGLVLIAAGLTVPSLQTLVPDNARPGAAAAILVVIAMLTLALRSRLRDDGERDLATVALSVAAFVAVTLLIVEPIAVDLNRVGTFADAVRLHRTAGGPVAFYKIGPDAADVKFMAALDDVVRPHFVRAAEEVGTLPVDVVIIANRDDFDTLPPELKARTRLLADGRIARLHCVAFVVLPSKSVGGAGSSP